MNDDEPRHTTLPVADIRTALESVLSCVAVRPRRLLLTTPGVSATVPMLRGVWGAALHDLDHEAWQIVFEGSGTGSQRTPLYVLRPAPPDPEIAPAIDWIEVGAALSHDSALLRAWDVASGMGLGPKRNRFFIKSVYGLRPDGVAEALADKPFDWTLDQAGSGAAAQGPCELVFDAPLRLIREGQLCTTPTLTDVVLGGLRRLRPLLPGSAQAELRRLWSPVLDLSRGMPSGHWQGRRADLVRWSGRQKTELELRGVSGTLELPEGAGPLFPLLTALQWLHLGKGTVYGLGQLSLR